MSRQHPQLPQSGSVMRLRGILGGLAHVAEIDLLEWKGRSWRDWAPGGAIRAMSVPSDWPVARWTRVSTHGTPTKAKGLFRYLWAVASMRRPHALPLAASRSPHPSHRLVARTVPDLDRYDVVWFFKLDAALALAPLFDAVAERAIVDLDDLVSLDRDLTPEKLGTPRKGAATLRARLDAYVDAVDHDRWAYWRDHVVERAAAVVLANPDETDGIANPHTLVIPNGYDVPARRGAREVHTPARVLFVGVMHYFPNADGAQYLVDEIVPRLRERLDAPFEVRIVGHAADAVRRLDADPNVVVTGFVDDLDSELATADVVVVPLRHGTGTRLKILEAFAHEIPVVSTTVGASGLACENERHLLLADSSDAFAEACVRVIRDTELRARLTANAYDLVSTEYDWQAIGERVAELAESVIADTTNRDG